MFQLMSAAAAADEFNLRKRMSCFDSWAWDAYLKDSAVLIHRGDLALPGDLDLDAPRAPWFGKGNPAEAEWPAAFAALIGLSPDSLHAALGERDISGLVVDGGLTIAGALINANMNGGCFLLVLGPLQARNVSGGGAEIVINGPAMVSDSVIGHYNDGSLHFNGGLQTPLCVNSDHYLSVSEPQQIGFSWSSHDDVRNEIEEQFEEASEFEGAYDVLPIALAQRVRADLDGWERLETAMQLGKPVLFQPDGAPARHEAADPERIAAQWDRLRLVPEAERTPALYDAALAGSGWALIYTPEEYWTDERLAEAVRRSPELIDGVIPAERVTGEMVATAARRYGFDWLPEQFKS